MRDIRVQPVLRVFWQHARRYKWAALLGVGTLIIFEVIEILVPLYYKRLFDVLTSADGAPESAVAASVVTIILAIAGAQLLAWLFRRISQFALLYVEPRVMTDLMQTSFEYLEGHSYDFFTHNFTGTLVRRVSRIARAFEQVADQIQFSVGPIIVSLAGILVVLFLRHPFLGGAFAVWAALMIVVQVVLTRWKQKYNLELAERDSEATGILSDSITNDITVKMFSGARHEGTLFRRVTDELRRLRSFTWGIDEWINAVQGLLVIAIEFTLFYGAARLWQQGVLTVGDFALIQVYLINAISKLWGIGHMLRRMYEAFADASEMVEILNTPHEVADAPGARLLQVPTGRIEFKQVEFRYRMTRRVLDNFSFTIQPGEKVALVGPSGAGKSTVVKLLFRFHDIEVGAIEIDGQNIAHVTQESLRNAIALVPQEPILFHRTLKENIRYGRRNATDEEVVAAAIQAHCHEFIAGFPEKYDTLVGERGMRLSGGERQRVAIARAILKNAPILVLDEATSSLDSESEALIQQALETLMRGKTVIVIAHRLSTVMRMDRIVVVEDGRVSTTGTHQALLKKEGGIYKKLWEIQAGGFLAELGYQGL